MRKRTKAILRCIFFFALYLLLLSYWERMYLFSAFR